MYFPVASLAVTLKKAGAEYADMLSRLTSHANLFIEGTIIGRVLSLGLEVGLI
jgi:hypothetical protein